jgi:hypothetical protein
MTGAVKALRAPHHVSPNTTIRDVARALPTTQQRIGAPSHRMDDGAIAFALWSASKTIFFLRECE